jgi:phosphoenolpyruvate carboxylase
VVKRISSTLLLGPNIENKEIQITVQGQTISSNFDFRLLSLQLGELTECWGYKSGFSKNKNELSLDEQNVMGQLASLGYKKYLSFKNHPKFIPT